MTRHGGSGLKTAMRQKFGGHLEPPAEYAPVVHEEEAISG
jgi:hypothetical protein